MKNLKEIVTSAYQAGRTLGQMEGYLKALKERSEYEENNCVQRF